MRFSNTVTAAVLSLGSTAYAAKATSCATSKVCYALVIPDSTAQSGTGDIYFQLSAPTTYSWIALGQGSQMVGSNIFVIYTSSSGQNVTLSPRLATGHVMPQHDTTAQVTLLEGSGVSNGVMTANVRCSNCNTWSGGTMDFTSSSANWIYAYKSGDEIGSDDPNAAIRYHDDSGPFVWDISMAKGGNSDINPFIAAAAPSSASPSASSSSSPSSAPSASPSSSSSSSSSSHKKPFGGDSVKAHKVIVAHGVLAALAWVVFFPSGAILIRLGKGKNLVWIHAALQISGYVVFTAAVGLGIYIAQNLHYFTQAHPIIGLVLFAFLALQTTSGLVHHWLYKKSPTGGRNIVSWLHLGFGRAAVILGIINGGLGIKLAADGGYPIAYGYLCAFAFFAGFMGFAYLCAIVAGEVLRSRRRAAQLPAATSKSSTSQNDEVPVSANHSDVEKNVAAADAHDT